MKYSLRPRVTPVLAADEAEAVAEFEDEVAQLFDQAVFKFAFLDLAVDAQEFEAVAALERLLGLFGQVVGQHLREVVTLALCERALIGLGLDLIEQDVSAPAEAGAGAQVVQALRRHFELVQEQQVMAPWDFCDSLSQKFMGAAVIGLCLHPARRRR